MRDDCSGAACYASLAPAPAPRPMDPLLPPGVAIVPGTETDLATVARLAGVVWRAHYPGIITHDQIDYMLERGYSAAALARFVREPGPGWRSPGPTASRSGSRRGIARTSRRRRSSTSSTCCRRSTGAASEAR